MELGLRDIDKEVLTDIFSYLPNQGLASLVAVDKTTKTLLDTIRPDNSFWKQRVETLIEKYIHSPEGVIRDWETVYKNLLRGNYLSVAIIYDYVEIVEAYLRDMNDLHNMNKMLIFAVDSNSIDTIKLLLKHPDVDPSVYNNTAIISAAKASLRGQAGLRVFKLLLVDKRVDPSANDNEALIVVAGLRGATHVVKLLLADPRVDPSARNNEALVRACQQMQTETVKLLLADPRVNPADPHVGLDYSVSVFKLLLEDPRVDPSVNNNKAIMDACVVGSNDMIRLLLADPRVDRTVDHISLIVTAADRKHLGVVRVLIGSPRIPLVVKNTTVHKVLKVDPSLVVASLKRLIEIAAIPTVPKNRSKANKKLYNDMDMQSKLLTKYFWWSRLEVLYGVTSAEIMRMDINTDPLLLCIQYEHRV